MLQLVDAPATTITETAEGDRRVLQRGGGVGVQTIIFWAGHDKVCPVPGAGPAVWPEGSASMEAHCHRTPCRRNGPLASAKARCRFLFSTPGPFHARRLASAKSSGSPAAERGVNKRYFCFGTLADGAPTPRSHGPSGTGSCAYCPCLFGHTRLSM